MKRRRGEVMEIPSATWGNISRKLARLRALEGVLEHHTNTSDPSEVDLWLARKSKRATLLGLKIPIGEGKWRRVKGQ